jgi:hypothetical protein
MSLTGQLSAKTIGQRLAKAWQSGKIAVLQQTDF